jgi:UDP-N-acetylglucosamine--N-acetylmuramyl-(pentapeptide) pyrophosphoryl-undecaprenol N-acetylglucosamine transferase
MPEKPNIFLLCGKTGGPFFPYIALKEVLKADNNLIFIGVKNSFEEQAVKDYKIEFLPVIKLSILTFKKTDLSEFIKNLYDTLKIFLFLFSSTFKSGSLLLKYKPKIIFTTGTFLNIPIISAVAFLRTIKIIKTKIIVHQQDPMPGIANRFAARFADKITCVFDYSLKYFPTAKIIFNPINPNLYKPEKSLLGVELKKFFENPKPVLLIFGGGSGSLAINTWVIENLDKLLEKYQVLHLTGVLRDEMVFPARQGYLAIKFLIEEMPIILSLASRVVCRAGLGSITELLFLQKEAFLIPLPDSHQEINSQTVENYFEILEENQKDIWLEKVLDNNWSKQKYEKNNIQKSLDEYYSEILSV